MEVILLERIQNLGQIGDVVKVKPGYARNYLLPQKKALRATKNNITFFETERQALESLNDKRKTEAEKLAEDLKGRSVALVRQAADNGQLYGSVTARDIAVAVSEFGVEVSGRQVQLRDPIKQLGTQSVTIALHPDVSAEVSMSIVRSMDEYEAKMRGAAEEEEKIEAAYEVAGVAPENRDEVETLRDLGADELSAEEETEEEA